MIDKNQKTNWYKEVVVAAESKSKTEYLINNLNRDLTKRAAYMNELNKHEAKTIFTYRSRMMKVKTNYKGSYKDYNCRFCDKHEETQKHIIEDCTEFPMEGDKLRESDIFEEDPIKLKKISVKLNEIYKIIEDHENTSCAT